MQSFQKQWLRKLIYAALLAAMSILLGKYLAITTPTHRFSFENLPILAGAILLGPIYGMAIGITADLLGSLMVGYAIIPLITVCAALIGFTAGLLRRVTRRLPLPLSLACSVYGAHIVGSVLAKTAVLSYAYGSPFWVLFGTRTLLYAITATLEFLLLLALLRHDGIRRATEGRDIQ